MKLDTNDKVMIGISLAILASFVMVMGAWAFEVDKYKAIARYYYHRNVLNEAQKGTCSDTPQIDDAKIIKDLEIEGHRQIQQDIQWMDSEYFHN